jgi:hypothetical protein
MDTMFFFHQVGSFFWMAFRSRRAVRRPKPKRSQIQLTLLGREPDLHVAVGHGLLR